MQKSFVEDLWEQNPELIKDKLSEILDVEKNRLVYSNKTKDSGYLGFGIKEVSGKNYEDSIIVKDYKIKFIQDKSRPEIVDGWMSFMFGNCGKPYALKFISKRNQQIDKFMAEYEEKYNAETRNILDKMEGTANNPDALQYISKRNQQLDKFMAEYEEKYNAETRKMLNIMGFGIDKGLTK